jgi:hypothetical protein
VERKGGFAIGIVPIGLDLLWRDENVLPVLPAPRVDIATDVLDFGRVAIRIITTASVGISGMYHVE